MRSILSTPLTDIADMLAAEHEKKGEGLSLPLVYCAVTASWQYQILS